MREKMVLNSNISWVENNSSGLCNENLTSWNENMEKMYTYFYLLLFIPGLLLNTTALWVLCRHIRKKTKTVIFMINLALADLAHILSLPLRIYYYFTHTWPFGQGLCLFCFYLKYLNMYAAIVFLVCISVQRCIFLVNPFSARQWRRRYDLLISIIVWIVVGVACSPFILMRSSSSSSSSSGSVSPSNIGSSHTPVNNSCFKDLPMRKVSVSLAVTMMILGELFGFLIPLVSISYSSIRIAWSLKQRQIQDQQNSSTRNRLQSVTSNDPTDKYHQKQMNSEKQRALRMVLSCSGLFLICFAPYHINFLFYLMVSQNIVTHCVTRLAVKQFHPVSLCLASLSSCLNPLLYYFLTAEFRMHLTIRTASFSSSHLNSPISSPTQRSVQSRLLRMESSCSEKEQHYSDGKLLFS